MAGDSDLVLKIEIEPNRSPEVDFVADALTAWGELLKAAAEAIEPGTTARVELVGVEDGSQVFRFALRKIQEVGDRIKAGAAEYPIPAQAALSLAGLIGGTIVIVGITNAMTPDPRILDDQMAVFEQMRRDMAASLEVQRKSAEFYGILQDEPAFSEIFVFGADRAKPLYAIPRSDFAARSGMWSSAPSDVQPDEEPRTVVTEVQLIKPVLVGEPRRWTFAKDGIEFSAMMADPSMLEAIRNRTLAVPIAEGVIMRVEMQYRGRSLETYPLFKANKEGA